MSGKFVIKITNWHVAEGQEVARDAVLASYVYCGGENSSTFVSERKLKSRFNGRVANILVGQNQEALPRLLFTLFYCTLGFENAYCFSSILAIYF